MCSTISSPRWTPVRGTHGRRTFCALMVMPRSRSMSMRSRYWARMSRSSTTPVSCSMRSASVDLPWSMCAMMQKFLILAGSVNVVCAKLGISITPRAGPGVAGASVRAITPLSHGPGPDTHHVPSRGDRVDRALVQESAGGRCHLPHVGRHPLVAPPSVEEDSEVTDRLDGEHLLDHAVDRG